MLSREKLLSVAVIVSLIGVSSLYLFSAQQTTFRRDLSEIDESLVDSRLVTQGTISEKNDFQHTILLTLQEEGHLNSLTVAIDKDIIEDVLDEVHELRPGAKVEVEGLLEDYEGDLSLRVDELGEISIKEKAQSSFIEFSSLLENPTWYQNMEVKVRGEVIEKSNSSEGSTLTLSSLEDDEYWYELTCFWDDTIEEPLLGKPAVIVGEWTYDNSRGRWMLEATEDLEFKILKK